MSESSELSKSSTSLLEHQGRPVVEREIRLKWNGPQARMMLSDTLYLNVEGAIRSGKTTALVWKAITLAQNHPGMNLLLCRWTGDSLDAQLKPRFWELCPPELLVVKDPWRAKEEFVAFANGSRVYLRALKTSEESARFAKMSGLTLAWIGFDQPEEAPKEYYEYLQGRLSQKGYPLQMVLTPNPPEHHHWLAEEFPKEGKWEDHEFVTIATKDNEINLPDGYVAQLERAYPKGHPMRRRMLEGKRGLTMTGEAVYGRIFKYDYHVVPQKVTMEDQVYRCWDFGHHHPAVLWMKLTKDSGLRVLKVLQGKSQFLEDFVPQVLLEERRSFGELKGVQDTCDPTGAIPTSHGTKRTAVMILGEHGIYPILPAKANDPQVRDYAIQTIARMMLKLTPSGAALQIDPSCDTLIDGCVSGYVWADKLLRGMLRVPRKDGFYDHLQNCLEYGVLAFYIGQVDTRSLKSQDTAEDEDEDQPRVVMTNRAGY